MQITCSILPFLAVQLRIEDCIESPPPSSPTSHSVAVLKHFSLTACAGFFVSFLIPTISMAMAIMVFLIGSPRYNKVPPEVCMR